MEHLQLGLARKRLAEHWQLFAPAPQWHLRRHAAIELASAKAHGHTMNGTTLVVPLGFAVGAESRGQTRTWTSVGLWRHVPVALGLEVGQM